MNATPRDDGMVTAEAAVALLALTTLLGLLLGVLQVAAEELRCVDAVRAGARAAARGEADPVVIDTVLSEAPAGARVAVARQGDQVVVSVDVSRSVVPVRALPGVPLHASAVAAVEPGVTP